MHVDFDAARAAWARQESPLTFTVCEQTFTCVTTPSLGDAFDLMDAPEPVVTDINSQGIRAICGFIRRCLVPDSRPDWDALLYRPDALEAADIVYIGAQLAEQYAGRPFKPSGSSSPGRRSTGSTKTRQRGPKATPAD